MRRLRQQQVHVRVCLNQNCTLIYGGAQPRFVPVSKASAGATEGKKALSEEQMYHQEYEV